MFKPCITRPILNLSVEISCGGEGVGGRRMLLYLKLIADSDE
jgi:hypothetical protein